MATSLRRQELPGEIAPREAVEASTDVDVIEDEGAKEHGVEVEVAHRVLEHHPCDAQCATDLDMSPETPDAQARLTGNEQHRAAVKTKMATTEREKPRGKQRQGEIEPWEGGLQQCSSHS